MICYYCSRSIDLDDTGWSYWIDDVTLKKTFFHTECLEINEDVVLA